MKIRNLSFSTRNVVGPSFEWVWELEDMGYNGWEMVQEGTQRLTAENMDHVREILDTTSLELSIHLPFSDMNIASLNHGIRSEVLRQIEGHLSMADGFAKIAVLHPGYMSPYGAKLPLESWQASIGAIQDLCDLALDFDIIVAIENMPKMPNIFGKDPDEMLNILDQVDRKNVGMTLDLGHANTAGLVDDFLEKCMDRVVHMHIHDNHGRYDEHLPLGQGCIDWKNVMGKLSSYKGLMVTEMGSLAEGSQCIEYIRKL